jgi:hypothetical protein
VSLWMSLVPPLAQAGFVPLQAPVLLGTDAVVLAPGLPAHTAPQPDAPVAYVLPIGTPVHLQGSQGAWGQLDTGFWVELPLVASLQGTMEGSLEEARQAAMRTPQEAVWSERLAAWKARPASPPRVPLPSSLRLAAPQRPGEVHMDLRHDEPVPTTVWVLPQRGVARRGVPQGLPQPIEGCPDLESRDVRIEVDLRGERAIAFSTAERPPSSWLVEAPAQAHSAQVSTELRTWISGLSGGQPVSAHASEVGGEQWVRLWFRGGWQTEEFDSHIVADVFVRDGRRTVPPFAFIQTFAGHPFEHIPAWYRDLDGDGTLEVLFFSTCDTRATDRDGVELASSYGHCCGC